MKIKYAQSGKDCLILNSDDGRALVLGPKYWAAHRIKKDGINNLQDWCFKTLIPGNLFDRLYYGIKKFKKNGAYWNPLNKGLEKEISSFENAVLWSFQLDYQLFVKGFMISKKHYWKDKARARKKDL